MIRGVLMSVVLLGLLLYAVVRLAGMVEQAMPEAVTRVDIYPDRFTYRTHTYASISMLAVGLKAADEAPEKVGLHDCGRMDALEQVVDLLREQGYSRFEVELPEGC